MRAQDLAEPCPFVTTDDDALVAARTLTEQRLPALLVLDTDGLPHAVIPGSQLIRERVSFCAGDVPLLAAGALVALIVDGGPSGGVTPPPHSR